MTYSMSGINGGHNSHLCPTSICHVTIFHPTSKVLFKFHGFCDASEDAFAAVVYVRAVDANGEVCVSLVTSKTRVAPLKRLTIPRLELRMWCTLTYWLRFSPTSNECWMYQWLKFTRGLIALLFSVGYLVIRADSSQYVGNRGTRIAESIPPNRWNHVSGIDNPADCASRGLFPTELLSHDLWWDGPSWLKSDSSAWHKASSTSLTSSVVPEEEREVCLVSTTLCCRAV